jgi:type VI protein secretion system component Hcp
MDQNKTDLVMQFVQLDGTPVWAECALDVAPGDSLMKDFKSADYDHYSSFFEATNFSMSMAVHPNDDSTSAPTNHLRQPAPATKAPVTGPWTSWRSATTPAEARAVASKFPVEFDIFTFERIIDRASPIFFQACCTSSTFASAVLVKRISQGDQGGVSRPTVGYLRIDFTNVMITGVHWDDGDVVKETCEFICQGMKVTYRKQDLDGTVLGGPGGEFGAVWPTEGSLGILAGGRRL